MGIIAGLVDRLVGPRVLLADRVVHATPEELGLRAEEVEIPRAGGGSLRGLWVQGEPRAPSILFCPGNSGNLSGHLPYLEMLAHSGLGVLGFDYSGFGQSSGRPSLRSLLPDAEAALVALLARQSPAGKPAPPLGIFGVSLGANLALEVAARRSEVGAVAVEGLSIQREILRGVLSEGSIGPAPVRWIRSGEGPPASRLRHRLLDLRSSNARRIPRAFLGPVSSLAALFYPFTAKDPRRAASRMVKRPLFLIHGVEDRLLPFEAALEVRRCIEGPCRLWLIPEAGHAQEPALLCFEEYAAQLRSFFHAALGGESMPEPQLSFRSSPVPGGVRIDLEVEGPEGAYLVTLVAGEELIQRGVWASAVGGGTPSARLSLEASAPPEAAHAIRYHLAERRGPSWEPATDPRRETFNRVGPALQRLSAALCEGRLADSDLFLGELGAEVLPPAFDIILRLQRHRRYSLGKSARLPGKSPKRRRASIAAPLLLALAAAAFAGGCRSPSPFPEVGPVSEAETIRILDQRASSVRSLYAVVRVAIDSSRLSGAFDVACYYQRPGSLRMSAFKDILLGTRPIFDLVFTESEYALALHGEKEPGFRQGSLNRFPLDLKRMADLYWIREALFLPGAGLTPTSAAARIDSPERTGELGVLKRPAPAGGWARWHFDPRTLEVKGATLLPPGRTKPIDIAYGDYRAEGGAFIPGKVVVEDLEGDFKMRCLVRELELNPPVDRSLFHLEAPPGAKEIEE